MITLAALEGVIDASGTAARIEAMLPIGVRRRQLSVRTLLAGMCLALADGRPAHLTRVHRGVCQIFCARGFSLSGSGCLSVTIFSRYLMPCCPVYPAVPRNRTFRAVPGLMLRVPVFPASCAVAGACCLILRGSHGGPSHLSLNIADGNDAGG
jgi:hypothetical protein